MIPTPFNDAGLIMQGMGQVGQAIGQGVQGVRAEEMANRPIHPMLQQFVRSRLEQAQARMQAGADPAAEAQSYRDDLFKAVQEFNAASQVQAPQLNVPAVVPNTVGPAVPVQGTLGAIAQGQPQARPQPPVAQSQPQPPQAQMQPPQRPPSGPSIGELAQGAPPGGAPQGAPPPGMASMGEPQRPVEPRFGQSVPPQAPPGRPLTQRDFEQFTAMQPQLTTMDQLESARLAAGGRREAARMNADARVAASALTQAGMSERAAATLALAGQRLELQSGVKVFDILMRIRGLNATLANRGAIAQMNAGAKQNVAELYRKMMADALKARGVADANADSEGLQLAESILDASVKGLNALGATDVEREVTPGTPGTEGSLFPPQLPQPGTPPRTEWRVGEPANPSQQPVANPEPRKGKGKGKGKTKSKAELRREQLDAKLNKP